MAEDYAENLFQAVDTIVNERIKNLPYDRTIRAKIYDNSQAYYGLYQVTTNDVDHFNAYSDDISYNKDDEVYVRIPKAEYMEQKVIIGKYIPEIEIKGTSSVSGNKRFYIARPLNNNKSYITYDTDDNGNIGYWVDANIRLDSYQLFLYNVSSSPLNQYAPDDSQPFIQTIQAVLRHYVSEDGVLYADEITDFGNGHYMIDDGTTAALSYSQILDGQYAEIETEGVSSNSFEISFTPNQQFVHPYTIVSGYTTVASGAIIIAEYPLIFNASEELSSKYRSFTLTASNDQFFIYNAIGKYISSSTPIICTITFKYNNTLRPGAPFTENNDETTVDVERVNNSEDSLSLLEWDNNDIDIHSNDNEAILTLHVNTNKILSTSFYVERLAFKIKKKGVLYTLNKDFYFGYKQIDSDNNATTLNLYLNDDDILKYQKLLVDNNGNLINISSNGVTLGGKSLMADGTWAGNAETATTATNLVNKPNFTANNNTITVTVGGKTSDAFTVPFATNATKLTTETVGNGKQIISFTSGIPTVSTEQVGYDNQKPQPIYLNNGTLTTVPVIKIDNTNYTINEAITKIIAALTNNIQLKNNRTLWQDT